MHNQEWLECQDSARMLRYLKRSKRYHISDRKLRLFLVACARRVMCHMTDERSFQAIAVAERFADAQVGQRVRGAAWAAAKLAFSELHQVGQSAMLAGRVAWRCVEKHTWRRAIYAILDAAATVKGDESEPRVL